MQATEVPYQELELSNLLPPEDQMIELLNQMNALEADCRESL